MNLAHIFTGVGSDLGQLRQVVRSRRSKEAFTKQPSGDASPGAVSPGIIGQISQRENRLREAENDDRWLQVEGGSPIRWRSCTACAFLRAEHEPTCEVCGAQASNSKSNEHHKAVSSTASPASDDSADRGRHRMALTEVIVAGGAPHDPKNSDPKVQRHTLEVVAMAEAIQNKGGDSVEKLQQDSYSEIDSDEASDDGTDSDNEGAVIAGTLDAAPPVGTRVNILYDDDCWYLAQVLSTRGTKARVCFDNGEQASLNLAVHAVRLADYVSEDGCSETDEESGSEDDDKGEEGDDHSAQHLVEQTNDQEKPKVEEPPLDDQAEVDDENSDGEECVPGTLDEAPPVGTRVKVLYDNDLWYPAQIIVSRGTKATVAYDDDHEDEEVLDFDEHAVRLANFAEDGEAAAQSGPHQIAHVAKEGPEHTLLGNDADDSGADRTTGTILQRLDDVATQTGAVAGTS